MPAEPTQNSWTRAQQAQLLWQMTRSEFKLRDQGTVLGFCWTLLNPLLLFAVLYTVFRRWFEASVPHYPLYLLMGLVFWNFFSVSTTTAVRVLEHKRALLKTQNFPRLFVPCAGVLSIFLSFAVEWAAIILLCCFTVPLSLNLIVGIVGCAVLTLLLALGVAMLLSVFYIRVRDVEHVWGILLRIGFFLTPVFYPATVVDSRLMILFRLNPLYHLLGWARAGLGSPTHLSWAPAAVSGLIFIAGYIVFEDHETKLVESL